MLRAKELLHDPVSVIERSSDEPAVPLQRLARGTPLPIAANPTYCVPDVAYATEFVDTARLRLTHVAAAPLHRLAPNKSPITT